jgi:hypothetical protein
VVVVPILRTNRVQVLPTHEVVRVALRDGTVLRLSPGHPTADGRLFADLAPGDEMDSASISDVARIRYGEPYTYDILPDSDTGTYFAGGARIGSTLHAAPFSSSPSASACSVGPSAVESSVPP